MARPVILGGGRSRALDGTVDAGGLLLYWPPMRARRRAVGMALRDEIFEQPVVLRRWLDTQLEAVRGCTGAIREREIDYVFLAARGTSDHAGVYAQYVWGS